MIICPTPYPFKPVVDLIVAVVSVVYVTRKIKSKKCSSHTRNTQN